MRDTNISHNAVGRGGTLLAEAELPPEPALARELMRGFPRLQFDPELERAYARDREADALGFRAPLLVIAALIVGLTPLYDDSLLQLPERFNVHVRWIQFGFMLPALLLAAFAALRGRLRRLSVPLTGFAMLCLAGGILAERIIARQMGAAFPVCLFSAVLVAILLLSEIRLRVLLPFVLAVMFVYAVEETRDLGPSPCDYPTFLSVMLIQAVGLAGAYRLEVLSRRTWLNQCLLRHQAMVDALTGLYNRRHFNALAERLLAHAKRARIGLALCLIDLDHFKAFNDHYGHPAGDECLRRVAQALKGEGRRPLDICARLGGEEFVMLWFDIDFAAARVLAERARDSVFDLAIEHADSPTAPTVTVSMGVWHAVPPKSSTLHDMMVMADGLLYRAKVNGRDQVVAASGTGLVSDQPAGKGTVVR